MLSEQPREVECTLCAYPLSTQERGTLEGGAAGAGERPQLPEPLRNLVVNGTPPPFVDKHTYFRAPCHTARRRVKLPAVRPPLPPCPPTGEMKYAALPVSDPHSGVASSCAGGCTPVLGFSLSVTQLRSSTSPQYFIRAAFMLRPCYVHATSMLRPC